MSDTSLSNSTTSTTGTSSSASSAKSDGSDKTYLQRWLKFTANALKPPTDVLSSTPSETLDSPLLRGAEPMVKPTLGPRSAHSSPSLGSSTVKPIPIATAMKRSPSGGPRKSVSFAVDDNDKPIPIVSVVESMTTASTTSTTTHSSTTHSSRHSSSPRSPRSLPTHTHHYPPLHAPTSRLNPKDFTLYPSPSPSPPTSPMFRSSSAPGSSPLVPDSAHARMMARQKELEDEIADLTRRQLAREAASRENIAFQEALARESFHRKFRGGATSVTSNRSQSPSTSERIVLFPTPLPSPNLPNHNGSKRNSANLSPAVESFKTSPVERQPRSHTRNADIRPRTPSPADSVCAVVGEREDEVMIDAAATATEHKKGKRSSRSQCERCGLFGHVMTECMTPALSMKLPMRRKREPEMKEEMLEHGQPPMKGLRHVKWLNFNGGNVIR